MFVVAKNHVSKKMEVRKASEFFILRDSDRSYEKWEPPSSDCCSAVEKDHFGIPQGNFMVVYTIHAMSENEEELRARVSANHPQRIRNRKRYSVDNGKVLLACMKPCNTNSTQDTKSAVSNSKRKAQKTNEEEILKDSKKLEKKKLKPQPQKTKNEHAEVTFLSCQPQQQKPNEHREEQEPTDLISPERYMALQKELDEAQNQVLKLQAEKEEKLNFQILQNQMKDLNEKLNEKLQSESSGKFFHGYFVENLKGWTGASLLGEQAQEGKIYFGDHKFVAIDDIAKVEGSTFDLRKRIKGLICLIYDDVLQRALEPSKAKFPDPLPVEPVVVTTLKETLERMIWETAPKLERSIVSGTLRRVLGTLRDNAKFKALSEEERAKLRKEWADKMKTARQKRKEQQRKTNKNAHKQGRSKATIVSSSSDADSPQDNSDSD